jgi:hypothetical protein
MVKQKECEVNIMWIMIISFIAFYFVLLVPFGIFVMGLLKVASIADDQSERLEMEQGRDGQNV